MSTIMRISDLKQRNNLPAADFGKSERSETRPGESCVEPVEPPIIQEADLRTDETKCNPDSEQIELAGAMLHWRNSESVEQIQEADLRTDGATAEDDDNYSSSGWGYSYILSWINDATRMNRQEYENWREIQTLQKKDPNFIKRYLMILKSEEKVSIKNLTKFIEEGRRGGKASGENIKNSTETGKEGKKMENIDKKEELLKLLNDTEKKIIAEIVKGTDFNKIYQKVGISSKTFPCCMSDIYRKTKNIIPYGKKLKKTVLMEYLFNECKSGRGEVIIPESTLSSAKPVRRDTAAETEKCLNKPVCEESEKVSEQNAKVLENMLVDIGTHRILDGLKVSRDFLQGKYKKLCETLGDLLVQGLADKAKESPDYMLARDYDDAIFVLKSAIKELEGE